MSIIEQTCLAVYEEYLSTITPDAREYLTKELDWDNDVNNDLEEIAKDMGGWEINLSPKLGLTEGVDDLCEQYSEKDPFLLR